MILRMFLLSLVLLLPAPVAGADLTVEQQQALLDEANSAYARGVELKQSAPDMARAQFLDAAERFSQLADGGVNTGALHYNLGNAWFQAGDVGRAILEYRRAELLTPADPRLQSNLEFARSQRAIQLSPSGGRALMDVLNWWRRGLSTRVRAWSFAAIWMLLWVAIFMRFRHIGAVAWWQIACLGCVSLLLGGLVVLDRYSTPGEGVGVVLERDVIVRKGDGNGYAPQFAERLQPGVEFQLREARGEWMLVELVDGKQGWVPREAVKLLFEG